MRRRTGTIARVSAALAAALVTSVSLGACGGVQSDLPPMETPDDVHLQAQKIYDSFAGSVAERNAGNLLRAHALNGATDACLEKAGFPEWDWSLSRSYAAPEDALEASDWFGEPLRPVWSENEIASAPFVAAEAEMNRDDHGRPPAYEAAIDQCLETIDPTSDEDADAVSMPAGANALIDAWDDQLARADDELGGDDEERGACLRASSLAVLEETGQEYDEIGPVMSYAAGRAGPAPASPNDARATSAAWQRFLAQEREVVEADFACRKDDYEEHIMDLAPRIEEFASEHADEIDAAAAGWQEIVEKAKALKPGAD